MGKMKNVVHAGYQFEIGQKVLVRGVPCIIIDREDDDDYLCEPIDANVMVLGQWELGAGWVYERHIEKFNE